MDEQLMKLLAYLPPRVRDAAWSFVEKKGESRFLSEIRLRADAPLSLTYGAKNITSFPAGAVILTEREIAVTLQKLCEDSIHRFEASMREGYVILEGGYRIGIAGQAGLRAGSVQSVHAIRSLSIRIPHPTRHVADPILPRITEGGSIQSTLFYAPPGVGKTTLLRDLACALSRGESPRRVLLIDTRSELYMREMFRDNTVDVLEGYPRAKGIEIATRTLSPEVIICDEIGSKDEAEAILGALGAGVPLIASAHADSREALAKRPNIALLHEAGVFRYDIGLARAPLSERFSFEIFDRRMTEAPV